MATAAALFDSQLIDDTLEVRVDLRDVTFIDATALGKIVQLNNLLAERGGRLLLVAVPKPIERIFHIAGLAQLL